MEYGSSSEEIKCNGDEVSEEYVWSNVYGSSKKWEGVTMLRHTDPQAV